MNKIAFVLLLTIFSVNTHSDQQKKIFHKCMHDEMDYSNIVPQNYLETFEETYGERNLQSSIPQPIRITFDFKELDNSLNVNGLSYNIAQYLKKIMYAAQVYLNKLIKVYPRVKPIKMKWQNICLDVPVSQKIQTDGINDSDLHIYVTYQNEPESNSLANAIWCQLDPNPVVGRVQFNIGSMKIDESSTKDFQYHFSTSLHEIFHILGFSSQSMDYWIDPETGRPCGPENRYKIAQKERRWGTDDVIKVSSKNVIRVSRKHFACPSIDGMYLENQGGSGSMGSHWEKDLLGNDFMTASSSQGLETVSEFTAAFLLDTGFYAEINSNLLMPIYWGKNKGCDFFHNTCNSGKQFTEYADDSVEQSCDFFSQGIGYPNKMDYYTQCAKIVPYGNRYCEDSNKFQPNSILRQNTGAGSRCYISNAIIKGAEVLDMKGRCFKSKCSSDSSSIEVNIWENEYVTCNYPNQIINLDNLSNTTQGIMKCPDDFDLFCNFPKSCPNNCSMNGVCNNGYCICLTGWAGLDCSQNCPQDQAWDGSFCVKNCSRGQFKNFDNTCKSTCPYKQYGDINTGRCQLCHANCSACSGPASNQCLSCNNGYILSNNSCVEIICHPSCLSCSGTSANQCTVCARGNYLDSNKTCKPCQFPCETCSSATQCISCSQGYYLDQFSGKCASNQACHSSCLTCSAFRDPTKCNSCRDGYFVNRFGLCQKCDKSCDKCAYQQDRCLSCTIGYVQNKYNQRCYMSCHTSCKTCTVANDPSACKQCKDGYIMKNDLCIPCDKNCQTCEGESYLCTACDRGNQLDTQNKTCKAICQPNEYLDNNKQCQACTSPCASCQYNGYYCTSCISGYILNDRNYCQLDSKVCDKSCATCRQSNYQQVCESCREGMFLFNGQCFNCSSNCAICKNSQYCTSCKDGYIVDSRSGLCVQISVCKEGEFLDRTKQCKPCSYPCSNCLSYNICTSCISGYLLDKQNEICLPSIPKKCQYNEFLDKDDQSKPCSSSCATCQNEASRCTSCKQGLQLGKKNNICVVSIPTCRYYEFLDRNNQCKPCSSPCATCKYEASRCLRCIRGYDYTNFSCIKKSQTNEQICYPTCASCKISNNPRACESCKNGYTLIQGMCIMQRGNYSQPNN